MQSSYKGHKKSLNHNVVKVVKGGKCKIFKIVKSNNLNSMSSCEIPTDKDTDLLTGTGNGIGMTYYKDVNVIQEEKS